MRILHCPDSVGGHPHGLAAAERALGMQSIAVAYQPSPFGHVSDESLCENGISLWRKELTRWKLLAKAYCKFDVIHYNFGSPILRWRFNQDKTGKFVKLVLSAYVKLCYLIERKLLAKKIKIITYQGDDARQGDYSRSSFQYSIADEVDNTYYSPSTDQDKRILIHRFDQIADVIYALNPDILRVLPQRAKFLAYAHIDLSKWCLIDHPKSEIPIVLHAPSHAGAKGTRFILDAISRLRQEGVKFQFVLVENLKHSEARKLYETCDLVIDQLLAGWYGGFAVEAMALGKPVISYIREEDTAFIPSEMRDELPIIQATPESIYDVLHETITRGIHELPARGLASRAFVEKWHNPLRIAGQVIADYQNVKLNY